MGKLIFDFRNPKEPDQSGGSQLTERKEKVNKRYKLFFTNDNELKEESVKKGAKCDSGWIRINKACFYFSKKEASVAKARKKCKEKRNGARLMFELGNLHHWIQKTKTKKHIYWTSFATSNKKR